jgi:CDP-diacylglycerol--serine O-phosphatidyltransferase
LLNAKIKLFALKFKDYSLANNTMRYTLVILTAVLLVVFHFMAIPLIIALYILLSVFENRTAKTI